ncbi:MAG: DUF502 domain-containing protein [Balneolales bacterium]|nr:DUF502 domain-containing protein [Balneolales bacterium]
MPKPLFRYFLQGLLYIAPLAITAYIVYTLFIFIDSLLRSVLQSFLGPVIPGLGIFISILSLILLGYFGQSIIGRPLKVWIESFLAKIPILNIVYSAFSDLLSSLLGTERKFNKPVLVLVNPITNLEKMGFLTEEDLSNINEADKVAVYFPHSYNFSGELFIVPASQVRELDLNPGDVMKFIVSGGVAGFKENGGSESVANSK